MLAPDIAWTFFFSGFSKMQGIPLAWQRRQGACGEQSRAGDGGGGPQLVERIARTDGYIRLVPRLRIGFSLFCRMCMPERLAWECETGPADALDLQRCSTWALEGRRWISFSLKRSLSYLRWMRRGFGT